MHEKSVDEIDFGALTKDRSFHPSPDAWEDQILYFLLLDRFSDGNEKSFVGNDGKAVRKGRTARFNVKTDTDCAVGTEGAANKWRAAGDDWVGGNLKGLQSKLGYLKRLGVTAVWISPILKQCAYSDHTYHGYGTQNFLQVDPHFGTREDFQAFVEEAHAMRIFVILDVILNHAGDVFAYAPDRYEQRTPKGDVFMDARWDGEEYPVQAFRDAQGKPTLPIAPLDLEKNPDAWPDAAVWPRELQDPAAFTRKGHITHWDDFPEFVEGDFFNLKDIHLGKQDGETFHPSPALDALCAAYKFWMTYADLDGFRVDSVKHMGMGASHYFAEQMHAWAKKLGKKNFYLIAEIAGGRANAFKTLRETGMDAALGVDEIPTRMRDVVAGRCSAHDYFGLFSNAPATSRLPDEDEDPAWPRRKVVTFFDDHDQIGRPVKGRLAAEYSESRDCAECVVIAALGLNLMSMGIPCIYYGTEQALDGHAIDEKGDNRYTREALFGGAFGPFRSRDRHVFDEKSRVYRELAALAALRTNHPVLRRGRQYLREVHNDGTKNFSYPESDLDGSNYCGLVAWSRIHEETEYVCVLNTDFDHAQSGLVTVDNGIHPPNSKPLHCLYSTDPKQIGTTTGSPDAASGSAVCITVPPGGFAVYG